MQMMVNTRIFLNSRLQDFWVLTMLDSRIVIKGVNAVTLVNIVGDC